MTDDPITAGQKAKDAISSGLASRPVAVGALLALIAASVGGVYTYIGTMGTWNAGVFRAADTTLIGGIAPSAFATSTDLVNATGTMAMDRLPIKIGGQCYNPFRYDSTIANSGKDASAAFTNAEAQAVALGIPMCITGGNYTLNYWRITHAGLKVLLDTNAVITYGAGQNASMIVVNAAGVTIDGGVFDGNAANQSGSNRGFPLVDAPNQDDFTLTRATVQNTYGMGVRSMGNRIRVTYNKFFNTFHTAISSQNVTASYVVQDEVISDNIVDRSGEDPTTMLGTCISVQAVASDVLRPTIVRNKCKLPVPATFDANWQANNPAYFSVIGIEAVGFVTLDSYFNTTGGFNLYGTVVADNTVDGGGEGYSIGGSGTALSNNTSRNALYVAEELSVIDGSEIGGTDQMNALAGGSSIVKWTHHARRFTIASPTMISGGLGGTCVNWFLGSGSVLGGTCKLLGNSASSIGVSQNSAFGMDDRRLTVKDLAISGYHAIGVQALNPWGVKLSGNNDTGATQYVYQMTGSYGASVSTTTTAASPSGGSATVPVASTSGISVGYVATQGSIPAGTIVKAVDPNASTVTLTSSVSLADGVSITFAPAYFFTLDGNSGNTALTGSVVASGIPVVSPLPGSFSSGSILTGSYVKGTSQPGVASTVQADWYAP